MRIALSVGISLVVWAALASPGEACGFIYDVLAKRTWREDAQNALFVAVGTVQNPRGNAKDGGSVEFHITQVLRPHPRFDAEKMLTIERFIAVPDPKKPPQFVVFFDLDKGKVDAYGGVPVGPGVVDYFTGLLAPGVQPKGKDRSVLLRYCFDFLDHADAGVAADAFLEFMKTPDPDLAAMGKTLPADTLRRWLQKKDLDSDKLRMFGYLLAGCGTDADADLLRSIIDREAANKEPRMVDGVFTGYVLLRPKEGWALVRKRLADPDTEFVRCWSAYRAARYFGNNPSKAVPMDDVVAAMAVSLDRPDISDFAVEDLRRWKQWGLTDHVLSLYGKKPHDLNIIKNQIVRYALECPRPEAAAFVTKLEADDAERLDHARHFLQQEKLP